MAANKKRLYIALYPSGGSTGGEKRYHWALLIGPKSEAGAAVPGVQYHVKNHPLGGWAYEEKRVADVRAGTTLLARVVVAKLADEPRLVALLRAQPVVNGDPGWRCRTWVGRALAAVAADGACVGAAQLDWGVVEAFARRYVARKAAAGRYAEGEDMSKPKPTYDLLRGKEIVP
ncbi:hypothetical protein BDY21DRAFT_281204 [Lineolata rhizophorae]|uniref:Uncharacterized protein n=1 Tax=Lineolata rhizophorae TaxID=578093 RepID=A0A6A6P7X1_9PEZI|nr:hypothetical protein BDY21DRAFT_281204 [Lineolata rhizophorae]